MADPDRTEYFSDRAEVYARCRPGYPAAVAEAALARLPTPVRALDVGCGTGIASRLLAEAGAEVVGLEPNDAMRAAAQAAGGPIRYVAGTAEETGLPAGGFQLVLCAQAFHWFDALAALREFHRVLAPGGRLALLWNSRDATTPFGAAYARVAARAQDAAAAAGRYVSRSRSADPTAGGWFGPARTLRFPNDQPLTWDELVGRASSASYFPAADPLRAELLAELRAAFERSQTEGRVVFSQHAELTLAERRD